MKAVFITDLPESCKECRFADIWVNKEDGGCFLGQFSFTRLIGEDVVDISDEELAEGRLDDCPLRPLPEKAYGDEDDIEQTSYYDGWNDCLDEINT